MTLTMAKLWIYLIQFSAILGVSSAVTCYSCSGSLSTPGCGNPFDANTTATCIGNQCYTWNITNPNGNYIQVGCGTIDSLISCTGPVVFTLVYCSTDVCNAPSTTTCSGSKCNYPNPRPKTPAPCDICGYCPATPASNSTLKLARIKRASFRFRYYRNSAEVRNMHVLAMLASVVSALLCCGLFQY